MTDLSTIRARLEADYAAMSPQLRRAARFVLSRPADIALYPLRQVAAQAGVGPTTLVRLGGQLGFDGYNALRDLFRDGLRSGADWYYGSRAEQFISVRKESRFEPVHRGTAETLCRGIEEAFRSVPAAAVEAAGLAIARARRVFLLGLRSNYCTTFYFHYVLRTFSDNVVLLEDRMDMLIDELGDVGAGDVLLVVSYEPYALAAVRAVEHAVAAGAAVIALTDTPLSPVAKGAAHLFLVPTGGPSFYQSLVPTMALLEAIVCFVFARGGDKAVARVKAEFERRERFGVYWRDRP